MKLLRDVYSLCQGTRRFRKIKALQLYASLQLTRNSKAKRQMLQEKYQVSIQKTNQDTENNEIKHENDLKTKGIKKQKIFPNKPLKQQNVKKQNSSSEDFTEEDSDFSTLSDHQLGDKNVIDIGDGDLLVFLKDNQQTVVSGEFDFCVLHGQIQVNGFRISARHSLSDKQKLSMYSLSSLPKNSLLCFETTKIDNQNIPKNKQVIPNGGELLQLLNHNAVLISNKGDCEKLVDKICQYFDSIQQFFTEGSCNLIFVHNFIGQKLQSSSQSSTTAPNTQFTQHSLSSQLYIQWTPQQSQFIQKASNSFLSLNNSTSIQHQKESKSILLCGSKNCGKSMYALYSINKLLDSFERVCVLDTDLGQSLFHFPGTVSLFSMSKKDVEITNLTKVHFLKPVLSVFVGEFSPQKYIETYIAGIKKCFRFYEEYFANSPLIINTHGFMANVGELLLYEIIQIIQPRFVGLLSEDKGVLEHLQDNQLREERLNLVSELCNSSSQSQQVLQNNLIVADLSENAFRADALKVNEAKRHRKDELIFQYLTQTLKGQKSLLEHHLTPFSNLFQSHYGQLCLQTPFQAPIQSLTFIDMDSNKQISVNTFKTQRKESFDAIRKVSFDGQRKISFEGQQQQQLQKLNGPSRKLSNFDDILLEMLPNEEEQENNDFAENVAKYFNCAVVALFDSAFSMQNNQTANCIGFGFIRDVDIQNKTIELLTSQTVSFDLSRVTAIVKSSEVAFSKHFYLRNSATVMEISELSYDLKADFTSKRTIDVPFLLPKSCGLGNFSFRSRVSGRK